MNKPATKNRQPLASLDRPPSTLAADERGGNLAAVIKTCCQNSGAIINAGDNNITCIGNASNIAINSDEVIMRFIDLISQQASQINNLTDRVINLTEEIITLKLKLKGLQL